MNEANIRKYASLMTELGLTGLEIRENDRVVRLERTEPVAAVSVPAVPAAQSAMQPAAAQEANRVDYTSVLSPMVGVFYMAPAEDAEPFVKVGDSVRKGDTLCIIEAMKLMNEIPAQEDGVILEVCVQNGQIVEYGSELFRIRRSGG